MKGVSVRCGRKWQKQGISQSGDRESDALGHLEVVLNLAPAVLQAGFLLLRKAPALSHTGHTAVQALLMESTCDYFDTFCQALTSISVGALHSSYPLINLYIHMRTLINPHLNYNPLIFITHPPPTLLLLALPNCCACPHQTPILSQRGTPSPHFAHILTPLLSAFQTKFEFSGITHNNNNYTSQIMSTNNDNAQPGLNEQQLKSQQEIASLGLLQQEGRCRRFCHQIRVLKMNFLVEAVRFGLYLLVAFGIFYAFEKTNRVSLHQETYFSSEQVVYASEIRGLFPPLQGSHSKLVNKWRISYTNSLENPNNNIYSNYTLEFKSNNKIRIKYRGCEGDLFMSWQTFQYNLFISGFSMGQDMDREMVIEPDENDSRCIRGDGNFIENLKDVSIWSIFQDNLYLLVEKWKDGANAQYIILLELD